MEQLVDIGSESVVDSFLQRLLVHSPVSDLHSVNHDHRNKFAIELGPKRIVLNGSFLRHDIGVVLTHPINDRLRVVTEVAPRLPDERHGHRHVPHLMLNSMAGDKSKRSGVKPPAALVFVDIDNTLLPGAVVFLFAIEAWRNGLLRFSEVIPAMFEQRHFKRRGESDHRVASIQERALSLIHGHSEEEFERVARLTFDKRIRRRLFAEVTEVLSKHRDAGHEVFLISASPQGLVDVIAEKLGLTGGVGTQLEAEDGVFTGRLVGELLRGDGKREAALELSRIHAVALERCYAMADSMADLSLLESVGHPMAVNPDQALHREAQTRGWPVVWPAGTHRYRRLRT